MAFERPPRSEYPRMVREAEIPSGVGRGWWPILEELQAELDEISPGWRPIQVKEKFAVLRIYADPAGRIEHTHVDIGDGKELHFVDGATPADNEAFQRAIREAERRSAETCEECGAHAGLMRSEHGWLKTICPLCAERSGEGFTKARA